MPDREPSLQTPPSRAARRRLSDALEGPLGQLETSFDHLMLATDRLLAQGRVDEAAELVNEQQRLLGLVHHRFERAVADAVVEREAESVIAAALGPLHAPTPPRLVDRVPALVSAAVASIALAAMLALTMATSVPTHLVGASGGDRAAIAPPSVPDVTHPAGSNDRFPDRPLSQLSPSARHLVGDWQAQSAQANAPASPMPTFDAIAELVRYLLGELRLPAVEEVSIEGLLGIVDDVPVEVPVHRLSDPRRRDNPDDEVEDAPVPADAEAPEDDGTSDVSSPPPSDPGDDVDDVDGPSLSIPSSGFLPGL